MARATDDMGEPMDEAADPRPTRAMPRTPPPERGPAPTRRRSSSGNSQGSAAAPAPARSPEAPARARGAEPPARAPARKKAPPPGAKRRPKPAPAPRRERLLRHTVQKIDLWSVLKLSLCFYLCGLAVTIVAMASLWMIADAFGIVANVEEFIGDLLSSDDFKFLSGEMLRGVALVGLVVVMLQVVTTVIAAAFYNLFAQLFGGVEITVVEEEPIPRA